MQKCWESFTDYMTMLTGNGLLRRGTVAACLSAVGADLPKASVRHSLVKAPFCQSIMWVDCRPSH